MALDDLPALEQALQGIPWSRVGETTASAVLVVEGQDGREIMRLDAEKIEAAWRPSLTRQLEGKSEEVNHG